ncbi:hypothetical protein KM043_004412 [Ampulex compressa]|nr:hypothetical protein KM043_004412 [Ampulex compressa]
MFRLVDLAVSLTPAAMTPSAGNLNPVADNTKYPISSSTRTTTSSSLNKTRSKNDNPWSSKLNPNSIFPSRGGKASLPISSSTRATTSSSRDELDLVRRLQGYSAVPVGRR